MRVNDKKNTLSTEQWHRHFAEQLPELCEPCEPQASVDPQLVYWNAELAEALNLNGQDADTLVQVFGGNQRPECIQPVAQVYAGHQFGQFNPQLGDGRAHLLGEVKNRHHQWQDIALKGSGCTPFSRGGDGRAALGPMLREVLLSESLHALSIPTTRSLAVVTTGSSVHRQTPNGQPRSLKGAVLTRTAASHIRIGTFQWAALQVYQGALPKRVLAGLTDFSIERHYPHLMAMSDRVERTVAFFEAVVQQQAQLMAQWLSIGFIHGVMNTDNMSIAGETIDFGPCAMLEHYDPSAVFSSIDHQGRYAFGQQSAIAQWNLARLAEALLPLLGDDESTAVHLVTPGLRHFHALYDQYWLSQWQKKLGVEHLNASQFKPLLEDFLQLLEDQAADFTLACRTLADVLDGEPAEWLSLFHDTHSATLWLERWKMRVAEQVNSGEKINLSDKASQLRVINPLVVARNHHVESALIAAEAGDLLPFERLLSALQSPYAVESELREFAVPASRQFTEAYQTFCGT